MPDPTTVEVEVRRQVAREIEKSTRLENPFKPSYDEITDAINDMDNARFLWIVSEAIEARIASRFLDPSLGEPWEEQADA